MRNVLFDLKAKGVPVVLLSDANTFYIETILKVARVIVCTLCLHNTRHMVLETV